MELEAEENNRLCQFSKTKMCKFYILGKCTKGTQCPFAHESQEIKKLPDLRCTKLCNTWVQTGQCTNRTCLYAHSKDELRSTGAFHKTKLCRFMQIGHCTLGAKCNFAHSSVELREPETIDNLQPPPGLESMVTQLLSDDDDISDSSTRLPDDSVNLDLKPAYVHVPGLSPLESWLAQTNPAAVTQQDGFGTFDETAAWNQHMANSAMDFACYSPEGQGGNLAYSGGYDWASPWTSSNMMAEPYENSAVFGGGYNGGSGWDWQLFGRSMAIDQTDELTIKSTKPAKAAAKMRSVRTSESTLCPGSGSEGDTKA